MSATEQQIDSAIVRVLLRYLRHGEITTISGASTSEADAEFVLLHWAMSTEVDRLAKHLAANPHETERLLSEVRTETTGLARGRIDARDTLMAQRRSGDASRVVSLAPERHVDHGINRLFVWVLKRALDSLDRIVPCLPSDSPYMLRLRPVCDSISTIARSSQCADLFRSLRLADRPTPGDVRHAIRHRKPTYRLAAAAFMQLRLLEAGDKSAISSLLHYSVVAPLEPWRRFELLVALSIAEAIARQTSQSPTLAIISAGGPSSPIARCGKYEIYWQTRTGHFQEPTPEPSEELASAICEVFGVQWGSDRPDVVVIDTSIGGAVAIAEAKYLSGTLSRADGPFRDAILQLVRYSRGYGPGVLQRSIIACSRLPPGVSVGKPDSSCPFAIDLQGLLGASLADWRVA